MQKWLAEQGGWRWWVFLIVTIIISPIILMVTIGLGTRLLYDVTKSEDAYNTSCGAAILLTDVFHLRNTVGDSDFKDFFCENTKIYLFR